MKVNSSDTLIRQELLSKILGNKEVENNSTKNSNSALKQADKKSEGSRIANTKKCKRFKRIICSSDCVNTIKELKDLTYKKNRNGTIDYSRFNIDPHTFSAIWYAIDDYTVADLKKRKNNSYRGV